MLLTVIATPALSRGKQPMNCRVAHPNNKNKISTATNATAATILAGLTDPVASLATVAV